MSARALVRFDLAYLKRFAFIAGVDEVGRGSLIGPVVAAACCIPQGIFFPGINDSKRLSPKKRFFFYELLKNHPKVTYGIGHASLEEIEKLNIYHASLTAMRRALDALPNPPEFLLVDGVKLDYRDIPSEKIIGGDGKSQMIAAASIIAKETRDAQMRALALEYPGYGFEENMGYSTAYHLKALKELGPTPIHRKTYKPVENLLIWD